MAFFDPGPLVAQLINVANSPTARKAGAAAKSLIPYASGMPFGGYKPPPISSFPKLPLPRIGASPNTGTIARRIKPTATQTPTEPPPVADPLMGLYQSLIDQLQAPVDMPTGIDTENLMEQIKKAINPIYDQRRQAAENQSGRARKEVQDMYRALANDFERLAPQQLEQSQAAQKQLEDMYGQLRSNMQGQYSRISQEQGDLFKQLGIQDALPDVLAEQNAPMEEALNALTQNQAGQQQRFMDMGQADATFYREGSPNAVMAGNEISTDMLAQLGDYLNQIEAERASGIQGGYLDQLSQEQNRLAQAQQQAQNEIARRQEMLWGILDSQLNPKNPQKLTSGSFLSSLPPQMGQSVSQAFTRLQRSPEAIYGKVEDKRNPVPGSFVETTPEWYMAQADEMLRRGEIDATTHQALQMYLQLNFAN